MATMTSLRRRISELERQLSELSRQQEGMRRRLEREHAERLRQAEERMRRELSQSQQQLTQDFAARSRAMQEQLLAQMRQQAEELRAYDARMQAERQQLLAELQQVNNEMRSELDAMRAREQHRTEVSRAQAEQLEEQAIAQREVVEALPHAFFCDGQLDVYEEHLRQVQMFLSQGMCEAAAATADICLAELQILEINVRALQHEWEELFLEYRGEASMLYQLMMGFEQGPVSSPLGSFLLEDVDRMDWSSGVYPQVHDDVANAYRLVEGVDQAGSVERFLIESTAPRGRQMVQQITGLHRLSDRLMASITCIRNELFLSDGRELIAQQAEDILIQQGFSCVSSGYRNEDPLDSYVLVLTPNGIDTLTLTIVPVREDGVAVRNACLMSLDIQTTPGQEFVRRVAEDVVQVLEEGFRRSLEIEWDKAEAAPMDQVETLRKATPDMRLLVRRIERKYQ